MYIYCPELMMSVGSQSFLSLFFLAESVPRTEIHHILVVYLLSWLGVGHCGPQ